MTRQPLGYTADYYDASYNWSTPPMATQTGVNTSPNTCTKQRAIHVNIKSFNISALGSFFPSAHDLKLPSTSTLTTL